MSVSQTKTASVRMAVAVLAFLPGLVRAADKPGTKPAVEVQLKVGGKAAASVLFSENGELILCWASSTSPQADPAILPTTTHLAVYDANTGKCVAENSFAGDIVPRAVLPDGKRVLGFSLGRGGLSLYDLRTGKATCSTTEVEGVLESALSADGRRLLALGARDSCVCDVETGRVLARRVPPEEIGFRKPLALPAISDDGSEVAWAVGHKSDVVVVHKASDLGATPLAVLEGHTARISRVVFSHDGRYLASIAADGTLRVWDATSGKEVRRLLAETGGQPELSFSADGKYVVSGPGWESRPDQKVVFGVRVVEIASGKQIAWYPARDNHVVRAVFSADQRRLCTVAFGTGLMRVFDLPRGAADADAPSRVAPPDPTESLQIASFSYHGSGVASLSFLADGKTCRTCGADGCVREQDVDGRQEGPRWECHRNVSCKHVELASPDGKYAVSRAGEHNDLCLWQTGSGQELQQFGGMDRPIRAFAFSPDSKTFAWSKGPSDDDDATRVSPDISVCDVQMGKEVRKMAVKADPLSSLAFSPDGKTLAGGSSGHPRGVLESTAVILWDFASGRELQRLVGHEQRVVAIAFSADGRRLVTGDTSGVTILWDVSTGKELQRRELNNDGVMAVAISPDGKRALLGYFSSQVVVWDLTSGKQLLSMDRHHDQVTSVCFSPDGKTALSGSKDGSVRHWRLLP